jgi:pantoate--beta-alanine ligase
MEVLKSPDSAYQHVRQLRGQANSVGLVPTMGALHDGHLSLVAESGRRCDRTVATIFVNPTQFSANEDLDKYPRTLERDLDALANAGVDAVFIPTTEMMYPPGFSTYVQPPQVATRWEGEYRPEHFRGVTTIVLKLFQIIPATHAFFGRKDFQQWRVIEAMVEDLNVPIEIVACPIVREPDGLAMSSRNRYLSPTDRQRALSLSLALRKTADGLKSGERSVSRLQADMVATLEGEADSGGVDSIDYAAIVDAKTLEPVDSADHAVVALIAAHVGSTRLIDNLLWPGPDSAHDSNANE